LSAAVAMALIHAEMQVEIAPAVFAEHSELASMASAIDEIRKKQPKNEAPVIARASRARPLPLSFAQERVWAFSRTPEASAGYVVACIHRIHGHLDVELLQACMRHIHGRHEIFHTTFVELGGRAAQVVDPTQPLEVAFTDLAGVQKAEAEATTLFAAEARRGFDLGRLPLVRFHVVRVSDEEHWLLRCNHHIISDGWSWTVYFEELALSYEAKANGRPYPFREPDHLQHIDYAAWQRRVLKQDGSRYQDSVAWWLHRYADAPRPLELPFRRSGIVGQLDPAEGLLTWGVEPEVSGSLGKLARETRVTYYAVRLAAFAALLAEDVGERDLVLGTYVTNRDRVEWQRTFGFLGNLIALRLECDMNSSFRDWARVVSKRVAEAVAQGAIPYESLKAELHSRNVDLPEIKLIFSVNDKAKPISFAGVMLMPGERLITTMPWGFTLVCHQGNEAECRARFDAGAYDPVSVRAFLDRLSHLLASVADSPDEALSRHLRLVHARREQPLASTRIGRRGSGGRADRGR
jgi:hypothetical protein